MSGWTGRAIGVGTLLAALAGCNGTESEIAEAQSTSQTPEQTYTRYCFSCHAAGIAGAPKVGSAEQWAPRIAKGTEMLLAASIAGVPPGMPPRDSATDVPTRSWPRRSTT